MASPPPSSSSILSRAVQFRGGNDDMVDVADEEVMFLLGNVKIIAKSPAVRLLRVPAAMANDGTGRLPYVVAVDPSGAFLVSIAGWFDPAEDAAFRRRSLVVLRGVVPLGDKGSAPVQMSPIPDRDSPISSLSCVGFLVGTRGSHPQEQPYILAELQRAEKSDKAILLRVRSDSSAWSTTELGLPTSCSSSWNSEYVISHDGCLSWIDLSDGIISCNPYLDDPSLTFQKLPMGNLIEATSQNLRSYRCVAMSNGMLRFVQIGTLDNDLVVQMWTLVAADQSIGGIWKIDARVRLLDILSDVSYARRGLPAVVPAIVLLDPIFPGLVCCGAEEHLFTVDLFSKKVTDHQVFSRVDLPLNQQFISWERSNCSAEEFICCLEKKLTREKSSLSLLELKKEAMILVADHEGGLLSCRSKRRIISFLDFLSKIEISLKDLNQLLLSQQDVPGANDQANTDFFGTNYMGADEVIYRMRQSINEELSKKLPYILTIVRCRKEENPVGDKDDQLNELEKILDAIAILVSKNIEVGSDPLVSSAAIREQALMLINDSTARQGLSQSQMEKVIDTLKVMLSVEAAVLDLEDFSSREGSSTRDTNNLKLALRYKDVADAVLNEIYVRITSELLSPLPALMNQIESEMETNVLQFQEDLMVLYVSTKFEESIIKDIVKHVMEQDDVSGLGPEIERRFELFKRRKDNLELTLHALQVVANLIDHPDPVAGKGEAVPVSLLEIAKALEQDIKNINKEKEWSM
ncbi:hypothetical protein ACP70R_048831 [Stipagrostis hirtigluma subsp. patula]